jgi:hypothetical protein
MIRSLHLHLPRVALFSSVGIFAAACGGTDYLDSPDARPDPGTIADVSVGDSTSAVDARDSGSALIDVSVPGVGADSARNDAEAGARDPDAGLRDADAALRDAAAALRDGDVAIIDATLIDAARLDAGDAREAGDARLDVAPIDARSDVGLPDVGLPDVDATLFDAGALDAADAEAAALDADARSEAEARAPLPNLLASASTYALLAGQTITITPGPPFTTIVGDVGVFPGTSILTMPTGQPAGGVVHAGDPAALQAQTDLTVAYNNLAGRACGSNRSNVDLGGLTLPPSVYCFDDSAGLTGPLVLDARGDPDATWIFKIGTALTTATGASVSVINGGSACNVYWQVGSSAIIGTGTAMAGNIVALTSISLVSSSTILVGRALARNGGVTMDANVVSAAACQ